MSGANAAARQRELNGKKGRAERVYCTSGVTGLEHERNELASVSNVG